MKPYALAIFICSFIVPFGVAANELDCTLFDDVEAVFFLSPDCYLTTGGSNLPVTAHPTLGAFYDGVLFNRYPDSIRDAEFGCGTIEQAWQICTSDSRRAEIGGSCDGGREVNCAREVTGLCHSQLELGCARFELTEASMQQILDTAGIDVGPETLTPTPGTETYCTTQMIGDLGYSADVPDRQLVWACDEGDEERYAALALADQNADPSLPLLGWPWWDPDGPDNECRFYKALHECVLPNLGTPQPCEVPREDCTVEDLGSCVSTSWGVSYSRIADAGWVGGAEVSRPYCFRAVKYRGDFLAHLDDRAIDLNNRIGQYNSGSLGSSGFPAQLNMPPEFVAIMETCGFTWGGRWYDAAVATDPRVEACDPMHFELPVLGSERAGVDVILVADNTGSMRDDLVALKIAGRAIVTVLSDLGIDFRMGIVTFNDPAVRLVVPLTADADTLIAGINSLGASGGGDFPEHVYGGLMTAIGQPWRAGAARGIVLIGDAPPKDPEPGTGHTLDSVTAAARAGGLALLAPVEKAISEAIRIISIQVGGDAATRFYFESLAEGTDGRLLVAPTADEVADAVIEALVELTVPSNLPPDVSAAAASATHLWPPNHKMQDIEIDGVIDPDGDAVAIRVTGIFQDEPVSGPGSGKTAPDGEGLGDAVASVRAERDGGGDGRVYRIEFIAEDARGAEAAGAVPVCVPHDRKSDCVDGGPLHDSTAP